MNDWPVYRYRGVVERVIDGDTVIARLDLGLRVSTTVSLRIAGIDAPELFSGVDRDAGALARTFLQSLVLDKEVLIKTHRDRTSFNRYVADLYVRDEFGGGIDIANAMVRAGHAERSPS